jgi:transposase
LATDAAGTPLALTHTGANCHDSNMAVAVLDAIPPIRTPRGGRRRRPAAALMDRGYDYDAKVREPLRRRRIRPLVARRGRPHGSGLGSLRWVVEACFAWLFNFRRLRLRYERRDDIHQAFLSLGCALICWGKVSRFC